MSQENSSDDATENNNAEVDDAEIEAEIVQQRRKIFFAGWQRQSRDLGSFWLFLGLLGAVTYAFYWLLGNWPFANGIVAEWNDNALAFTLLCGLTAAGMFIRAGHVWAIYAALVIDAALVLMVPFTLVARICLLGGFMLGVLNSYQAIRVARLLRQHKVPLRST
ncbi:hypothetical protein [Anatilimnocola floriformis]|uniref:hypothetical protein n=1 Tax=Anatilimnocola floriformis TaxID=2948575 RepID=UPI0020C42A23|nr:hypothetical protein [Anatilimnocola floriformis]